MSVERGRDFQNNAPVVDSPVIPIDPRDKQI